VIVCTDDGSYGRHGFVTDAVKELLEAGGVDQVYAVGPVPMMRAVAGLTAGPPVVPTLVSLNAIMVDGTGMCGGCRVSIGGRSLYACVDGPEFDAHQVDFAVLADRLVTYRVAEQTALERRACMVDTLAERADGSAATPVAGGGAAR
jgi:ferredoxin--NADP+ reductase